MPEGIYSSLVERRSTERRKVNSVSSFDSQEGSFREGGVFFLFLFFFFGN